MQMIADLAFIKINYSSLILNLNYFKKNTISFEFPENIISPMNMALIRKINLCQKGAAVIYFDFLWMYVVARAEVSTNKTKSYCCTALLKAL